MLSRMIFVGKFPLRNSELFFRERYIEMAAAVNSKLNSTLSFQSDNSEMIVMW